MPAMPGKRQRRAGDRQDADHQERVHDHRDVGEEAEDAVADDHEDDDGDERHDRGDGAGADRILRRGSGRRCAPRRW